jgi:hypothetical protein
MYLETELHTHLNEPSLSTHSVGGWVGPRAKLGISENRKIPDPARKLTIDCPTHNLVVIPTELSWLLIYDGKKTVIYLYFVSFSTIHFFTVTDICKT